MKIAFLFPGQGSQSVGMGRDAMQNDAGAAAIVKRADDVLGFPFSDIYLNGPEEDLKQTQNTQPALYVTSAATLAVLRAAGIEPFAVAGHSLGEYTALHAAGSIGFEDGVGLVRTRGEAFAAAGKARPGAMAAIIGLEGKQVADLCAQASTGDAVAVPANYNDPTQTVISGDPAAVEKACELCKAAGAKRALPLPVSGAFHSPLVAPAAEVMRVALSKVDVKAPSCVFVNNVDADVQADPAAIRESLVRQVTGSVRWVGCVERLVAAGAQAFVEVGAGKVLAGLAKRVAKDIPCHTTESWDAIQKTIAALKQ